MAIVGTIALIALVVLGVMVLRVKSDPRENESVREYLTDLKQTGAAPPPDGAQAADPGTRTVEKMGN